MASYEDDDEYEAVVCDHCGPGTIVWPRGDLLCCTICNRAVGDVALRLPKCAFSEEPPPLPPSRSLTPSSTSSTTSTWLGRMVNVFSRCPDCNNANIVEDMRLGEATCNMCGLVIHERMLDYRPEWRSVADADDPGSGADKSRVGCATESSDDLKLRIGDTNRASVFNTRLLQRNNAAAWGKPQPARDIEAEARDMSDMLRTFLMYTDPMVELARQLFYDYNHDVQRVKGADNKAAAFAACAYIASGVNGHSGERRDMDEVCTAFCARKDAAKRFCSKLREKLAGKPYRDVLLRPTDIMDAAARRIWDLPPEVLPQGLVRPVVNVTEWIRTVIGDAAGSKDPVKFGNSVIAVAVVECVAQGIASASPLSSPLSSAGLTAVTGKELAKELKIGAPTFSRNDDIIRKAVHRRAGEDALRAKVDEIIKRCERVVMLQRGSRCRAA